MLYWLKMDRSIPQGDYWMEISRVSVNTVTKNDCCNQGDRVSALFYHADQKMFHQMQRNAGNWYRLISFAINNFRNSNSQQVSFNKWYFMASNIDA